MKNMWLFSHSNSELAHSAESLQFEKLLGMFLKSVLCTHSRHCKYYLIHMVHETLYGDVSDLRFGIRGGEAQTEDEVSHRGICRCAAVKHNLADLLKC